MPRQRHPFSSSSSATRTRRRKGVDFAKKKPQIVAACMAEFTKDRYGVDVMKVEMPINMKFVEGTQAFAGQKAYTKQEALDHFRRTAEVATKPFIYLSAGVSNAEFTESLDLAAEAGTRYSGVLCGRATWKDGIPVTAAGRAAFKAWLESEGVKNIENVNARLKPAHPWFEFYGAKSADEWVTSNPKLQIPNPNHAQIQTFQDKSQSPVRARQLGVGRWEWLGFGIWSLGFDLSAAQGLDAAHLPQAGIARVRHTNRGDADLGRALQGDVTVDDPCRVGYALGGPVDRGAADRALGGAGQLQVVAQVALNEPRGRRAGLLAHVPLEIGTGARRRIRLDEVQLPSRLPSRPWSEQSHVAAFEAEAGRSRCGDSPADNQLCNFLQSGLYQISGAGRARNNRRGDGEYSRLAGVKSLWTIATRAL